MRPCTKCHFEKPESEFYFQSRVRMQLHAECKACYKSHRKVYAAEHYKKYGDLYRQRSKIRRATIRKGLQQNILEYLRNEACVTCGENDMRVLDFDHIDPSHKAFGISKTITDGLRWEVILEEIKKCRILCANCHRKHTATQFGWYRTLLESD